MSRDPAQVPKTFVNHRDQLDDLARALSQAVRVAIDTETPIDGPHQGEMRVMSVAVRAPDGSERAFVVDARDLDPTLLAPLLDGVTADAWNANFDARVVDAAVWSSSDATPHLTWWDAQIADALIYQGRSGFNWFHGLAWATEHYLGLAAQGKGTVQLSYTATDDLSPTQIAYAAADALETLWVADAIRSELSEAGLDEICEIELAARPFLDRMERSGLPFDWPGWEAELGLIEARRRDAIGRLAAVTGGGQGTLFDSVVEPSWNPASDLQVRGALNRWSSDEVNAWTERRFGEARPLTADDSVTAGVLAEIGGELAGALLDFRSYSKILTTYGESIHEYVDLDGRLRPQYLQVVGTNTGRLASRNPNAQNFTPLMKPFFRSPKPDRVFVHADLSQAELRFLAQVAEDAPLTEAFARGDDIHIATAASMFGFDPVKLAASDPDRLKHLRQTAKALNFGIAYGSGAAALARTLSAEGSPTTRDEAGELLAQYRRTYPGTAAWAEARIAEIRELRGRAIEIDWALSMRLARGFAEMAAVRRSFRRSRSRWPTAAEIAVAHPRSESVEEIEWLLGYSAPVALLAGGEPFTFASRTRAGRRQQFNLHLDRLFLEAATDSIESDTRDSATVRRNFESTHSVDLSNPKRALEDRALRRHYVEAIGAELGDTAMFAYLTRAAKERISAMVNAWRNAPIQGGVADIMLVAYADLQDRMASFPTARPVQTVHDSVVIECDRSDAPSLVVEVRDALEEASRRLCPDVVPKADVDIRSSLAEADVVDGARRPGKPATAI